MADAERDETHAACCRQAQGAPPCRSKRARGASDSIGSEYLAVVSDVAVGGFQQFDQACNATSGQWRARVHWRLIVCSPGSGFRKFCRAGIGCQKLDDQMIVDPTELGHDLVACQIRHKHLQWLSGGVLSLVYVAL